MPKNSEQIAQFILDALLVGAGFCITVMLILIALFAYHSKKN